MKSMPLMIQKLTRMRKINSMYVQKITIGV